MRYNQKVKSGLKWRSYMDKFLEQGYAMKLIVVILAIGVVARCALWGYYKSMLLACGKMNSTKHYVIQHLREQFISRYQAEFGVQNVDIFVDKYLINCRLFGILLSTWESICGQTLWDILLIAALGSFLALLHNLSETLILSTIFAGICGTSLLVIFDGIGQLSTKKRRIRLQMRDYLENCFQVRLESEFQNLKKDGELKNRVKIAEAQLAITDEAVYRKQQKKVRKAEVVLQKQERKEQKQETKWKKNKEKKAKRWTLQTGHFSKKTQKQENPRWNEAEKNRLREELQRKRNLPRKGTEEVAATVLSDVSKENRQAEKLVQTIQEEKKWESLIEEVLQEYLTE